MDGYHRFSWEIRNRDGVITRHSSCIQLHDPPSVTPPMKPWPPWPILRCGKCQVLSTQRWISPMFFFLPRDRSSHFCGFIMFHPIHHGIWGMFKTRGKLFHYCWLLLVIVGYTMLYPSINHHWIS